MTTVLLLAFLTQSPDAARGPDPKLEPAPSTDSPTAAEVKPRETWPVGATKRFLGALTGGVVGLAAPAAIIVAANSCGISVFSGCLGAIGWNLVASAVGPFTVTIGSLLGHWLMGGEVSVGAAIAGLLGGLSLGSFFTLLNLLMVPAPSEQAVPAVIAASALGIVLQAIALESRTEALADTPELAAPTSRFLLSSLATLGVVALAGVVAALASGAAGPGAAVLTAVLFSAAAPLVPFAVHRGLGGRGTVLWAYLGMLASGVVATAAIFGALVFAFGGLGMNADARAIVTPASFTVLGALVATLGMPLMLEFGHGLEVRKERAVDEPRLSAGIAPVVSPSGLSGGALSFSGTF